MVNLWRRAIEVQFCAIKLAEKCNQGDLIFVMLYIASHPRCIIIKIRNIVIMKTTNKKNSRFISLSAIATLGSVFLIGCGSLSWQEYKSSEGKYSVSMPGQVEEETKDSSTVGDTTLKENSASTELRNSYYTVSYTDYPENYVNIIGKEGNLVDSILSQTVQVYVAGFGSDADSAKKESVKVNDVPCQRFESPANIAGIEGEVEGIVCWDENRLYQVIVAGTKEDVDQYAPKFLDSFTIEK